MFVEFSKRFEDLLRLFPTEAWLANRNPAQPLPSSSPELKLRTPKSTMNKMLHFLLCCSGMPTKA